MKRNGSLQSRDVMCLCIRMFQIFIETYILSVLQTASQVPIAAGSAFLFIGCQASITERMSSLQFTNVVNAIDLVRQRRVLRIPLLHLKLECRVP